LVEVVTRKVNEIRPDPNNPRKTWDEDKLKESSESYKHQGVMVPIEIDTKNVIICGELRWRAANLAGLKEIPCMIREGLTPEQRLERQMVENLDRQDMKMDEIIPAIKKLVSTFARTKVKQGNNDEMHRLVAAKLGKSEAWISEILCFDKHASKELKKAVENDEIGTKTAARIAIRLPNEPELQNKLLDEWKTGGYGRDEIMANASDLEKAPEFLKEAIKEGKMTIADAVNEIKVAGEKGVLREADPNKQFRDDMKRTHAYYRDLGMRIAIWKANKYYERLKQEDAMKELVLTRNTIKIMDDHAERLTKITEAK